jgi:hypothetical protein
MHPTPDLNSGRKPVDPSLAAMLPAAMFPAPLGPLAEARPGCGKTSRIFQKPEGAWLSEYLHVKVSNQF